MWQLRTLPTGEKIVSTNLSEHMTLMLLRPRGAPLHMNIFSDEAEPRLFDKIRLPILTVDGEKAVDFNESLSFQNSTWKHRGGPENLERGISGFSA